MQISDKCAPGILELLPLTRMSARAIDKTYWLILQIIMTPTLRTTKMPLPFCSYGLKRMVYVDAFNLYFGALKGTPYKWLDILTLVRNMLTANNDSRPWHPSTSTSVSPSFRRVSSRPC